MSTVLVTEATDLPGPYFRLVHEPARGTGAEIRPAGPADRERLREIAHAAKAHWGYDQKLVSDWAADLDFTGEPDRRELFVAVTDAGVIAWLGLTHQGNECVLDNLWVDPKWIGLGVGTQLFNHSVARARLLGVKRLEWAAEPNAVGFYERMGGRRVRSHTTEWGRQVPWMALDL